jgi:hypothetical protein
VAYTTVADDGIGIRVQPFPRTEVIRQVTEDGEVFPVWSADGTTLLFRLRRDTGQPAQLMGLDVNTTGTLTFRNPRNLPVHGALLYANYRDYDLMPDGRRLLVIVPSESPERATAGPEGPRLDVVLNWTEELNARVPVP